MNDNTTCCQTGDCHSAVAEATDTTTTTAVHTVEASWKADRHDQGVELEVTLPGVRKEDLEVEVQSQLLQLTATRRKPENAGRLIYGRPTPDGYRLKLRLGNSLDGSQLKANLSDGILKVSIPLVAAAQPRKVEIH
ncbi:MAG: Hsp20/alpha crystallin family protein [Verrucomicrobiota bacterium]